jgi:hypothetical protein
MQWLTAKSCEVWQMCFDRRAPGAAAVILARSAARTMDRIYHCVPECRIRALHRINH